MTTPDGMTAAKLSNGTDSFLRTNAGHTSRLEVSLGGSSHDSGSGLGASTLLQIGYVAPVHLMFVNKLVQ